MLQRLQLFGTWQFEKECEKELNYKQDVIGSPINTCCDFHYVRYSLQQNTIKRGPTYCVSVTVTNLWNSTQVTVFIWHTQIFTELSMVNCKLQSMDCPMRH